MVEKLQNLYEILAKIPVTGDSVDLMHAARNLMREMYQELVRSAEVGRNTAGEKVE